MHMSVLHSPHCLCAVRGMQVNQTQDAAQVRAHSTRCSSPSAAQHELTIFSIQ